LPIRAGKNHLAIEYSHGLIQENGDWEKTEKYLVIFNQRVMVNIITSYLLKKSYTSHYNFNLTCSFFLVP
jgi:hypothetical protein